MASLQSYFIRSLVRLYRLRLDLALGSVPRLRAVSGAGSSQRSVPKGIDCESVASDGVRCEWLCPPKTSPDDVLLYLHGGFGVLGLYNSHRWMVGHLSLTCNLRALLPDYRLAPEHSFPAGLEDCLAAYRWLLFSGLTPKHIVIVGDSIGGYLTLGTLPVARDAGLPLPAAAVCMSPNTDFTLSRRSIQSNARRDALLSARSMHSLPPYYIGGHDLSDPRLSPLRADLHGLPPILIQVGADELLLDDSIRFSDFARAAGIDVVLEIWPKMWHDWHLFVPYLPEANQAIGRIAEFVRNHLEVT